MAGNSALLSDIAWAHRMAGRPAVENDLVALVPQQSIGAPEAPLDPVVNEPPMPAVLPKPDKGVSTTGRTKS